MRFLALPPSKWVWALETLKPYFCEMFLLCRPNYAQRAGRAGRNLDAAAFVLTFAKLSSHDLAFFKDPKRMIGGTILPPLFKVDNEKIVRRHIYAVALSIYFADHEDQYNHNDADKFINLKRDTRALLSGSIAILKDF